jgi:hypothetical protein
MTDDDDKLHLPPGVDRGLGDSEAAFRELRAAMQRAIEAVDVATIKFEAPTEKGGGNIRDVTAALATGVGTALATVLYTCITTSHRDRKELFDHLVDLIQMQGSATLELLDKARAAESGGA